MGYTNAAFFDLAWFKKNNITLIVDEKGNLRRVIGPLQDPVTWYGINYTGTQMTQWDFQNKGTLTVQRDFPLF